MIKHLCSYLFTKFSILLRNFLRSLSVSQSEHFTWVLYCMTHFNKNIFQMTPTHTRTICIYQSVWPSARGRKRNERANEWRKPDRMWNDMQGNKLFIFDQRSLLVSVDVRTECDVEMFILKQTPFPLSAHSDFNWFLCWEFFYFLTFFLLSIELKFYTVDCWLLSLQPLMVCYLLLLLLSLFLLLLLLLGCYHNTNKLNLLIAI